MPTYLRAHHVFSSEFDVGKVTRSPTSSQALPATVIQKLSRSHDNDKDLE